MKIKYLIAGIISTVLFTACGANLQGRMTLATPLPDLKITNVRSAELSEYGPSSGYNQSFDIKVKNRGDADTTSYPVVVPYVNNAPLSSTQYSADPQLANISAGDFGVTNIELYNDEASEIEFCVETSEAESKEDNNCLLFEISLSDLIITDASLGERDLDCSSMNTAFEVTINNIGDAESNMINIPTLLDGVSTISNVCPQDSLEAGESTTVLVHFDSDSHEGDLEFCAEHTDLDRDDSNNCYLATFPQADLEITDVVNTWGYAASGSYIYEISVSNIGDADSSSIDITALEDGIEIPSYLDPEDYQLYHGNSQTFEVQVSLDDASVLEFCVEHPGSENNAGNNCFELSVS